MNKSDVEFVDMLIKHYGQDIQVVSILQDVQKEYSYVPEGIVRQISKQLKIPVQDFYGVATFYSQFRLKRSGRYVINICSGTACHVKGGRQLIDDLKDILKIDVGETTADGMFTLEPVNCIGACAKAPSMLIGDTVYGNLTRAKIEDVIRGLRDD